MRWHLYLQTSGVDEAKLTWKLYWQLKVSQISYFWPIFPKWAVAQLVKGRHREHLNHRFAGSNPDTAGSRLAHILFSGFYLPKWWIEKSGNFSDFSRWYFFLNEINFFKEFSLFEVMTRTDCLQNWKSKQEMQRCQMFYKTLWGKIFKFKFNVNKDHK